MDDNVMKILQLVQEGKISAGEAENLLAALRGETVTKPAEASSTKSPEAKAAKDGDSPGGFDKIKAPKINLKSLGDTISEAIAKVQPEKIAQKVQTQLREASRASAKWGTSVSQKVRAWADGDDTRPTNGAGLPEHAEEQTQEFHLDDGASVLIDNPLGDVKVAGVDGETATVFVKKTVWGVRTEELLGHAAKIEVSLHGTDSRLDVKVSLPDAFHDGVADIEVKVPRSANVRVTTRFGHANLKELNGRSEAVTTSGSLTLTDLGGDARGETASGDLRLQKIAGTASIATQSGDIHAEDIQKGLTANTASGDVKAERIEGGKVECKSVSGDVLVETVGVQAPLDITVESVSGDAVLLQAAGNIALKAVSGDIRAENVSATRVQAQTVSGDVSLQLRDVFSGMIQVNTVSGDADIRLPEGSNVRVSLSTTSGDLRCEHDAHEVTATETLWTGQIGTGAGTLNVQSISGDAIIKRA